MSRQRRDILFLAQRVPFPPDRGDRITTWNILRHFVEAGHRVRVGCFLEHAHETESVDALRERGVEEVHAFRIRGSLRRLKSLPYLASSQPLTRPYFAHRGLHRALCASLRARAADVCFAYSSSMGFAMLDLADELEDARRISFFAELDSDKWAQYAESQGFPGNWIYKREAKRLLEWERRLAHASHANIVVSSIEKDIFQARIPGAPCQVMQNGVDLEHFCPDPSVDKVPHSLVFTGVMNYLPNVDAVTHFVEASWPAIRARFSNARFFVVGSSPNPAIRELDGRDGIEVTGRVPETVPWMQKASVAVAPLRIARGIQNKVLEALACGLPTVCSPKAHGGIDAIDGEHLIVAEDDDAMTKAVCELFENQARNRELGAAARARVEERYAWPKILEALDELIA